MCAATKRLLRKGSLLYCWSTVVTLAACSGLQPVAATGAAVLHSGLTKTYDTYGNSAPLLYVADSSGYNDVKLYRANGIDPSPIAVYSDDLETPAGDCIDGDGTLYVTNEPAGRGWVTVFPQGSMKPSHIIKKGVNTPAFCAVDDNGNLWVTNIGGPNVTEYEKGSLKPRSVVTKGVVYPDGIAFDGAGNMYVANLLTEVPRAETFGPGNVVVYSAGSESPSRTITDGVVSPVGIAVDSVGTLYVTNETENSIEEYRSAQSVPFQAITQGLNDPIAVTVDRKGRLYVTDGGNGTVVEFAPGSITPSRRKITKGLFHPFGTAYSPPLLP